MCVACGPVVEAGAPAPNDVDRLRAILCVAIYIFASAACQGSVRCPEAGRAGYYYYTHTHTHIQNCHFI